MYGIVPLPVKGMLFDTDCFEFAVTDLDSFFIKVLGVAAILGNHELWLNYYQLIANLAK